VELQYREVRRVLPHHCKVTEQTGAENRTHFTPYVGCKKSNKKDRETKEGGKGVQKKM